MTGIENEEVIPLIDEQIITHIKEEQTGKVSIRIITEETSTLVSQLLKRDDVEIRRIQVDHFVDQAPSIREDGDTIIIPVLEERLVVEKRLFLKEEIHVSRRVTRERFEEHVPVRSQRPIVDREQLDGTSKPAA